jgi:hypothetical protein
VVADVDVFRAGEGNADAPGLLGRIVAEALFEEGVIETHGEVGEAELTRGMADGATAA